MQAQNTDMMRDALAARRGKGLEIIIGMGKPTGDQEGGMHGAPRSPDGYGMRESGDEAGNHDVTQDLAPAPDSIEDRQAAMGSARGMHDANTPGVVSSQHEMSPGDVETPEDARAHFSQNMSEHDIRDIADRKPRSLSERARQFAFSKGAKKEKEKVSKTE